MEKKYRKIIQNYAEYELQFNVPHALAGVALLRNMCYLGFWWTPGPMKFSEFIGPG
jgi:hypothetical protein